MWKWKSIQDVINKEAGKGPTISGAERLRLLIAEEHWWREHGWKPSPRKKEVREPWRQHRPCAATGKNLFSASNLVLSVIKWLPWNLNRGSLGNMFPIKHKFFSTSEAGWDEANNNKMIPAWDRMNNVLSPRSGRSMPDARIQVLFDSESTREAGLKSDSWILLYLLLPEPPVCTVTFSGIFVITSV